MRYVLVLILFLSQCVTNTNMSTPLMPIETMSIQSGAIDTIIDTCVTNLTFQIKAQKGFYRYRLCRIKDGFSSPNSAIIMKDSLYAPEVKSYNVVSFDKFPFYLYVNAPARDSVAYDTIAGEIYTDTYHIKEDFIDSIFCDTVLYFDEYTFTGVLE